MSKTTMMRIGIFGGTFNPPHLGHLIVAESVCEQLRLDKLFFVPSFISPHKRKREQKLALHRLRMVRLAIKKNPRFDFSDLELKRKGVSYTYTTVETFHRNYPGCRLFLIIGADNFVEFHTWKNPRRIVELASLVVMNRTIHESRKANKEFSKSVRLASVPDIQISSSEIRKMVRRHKSIQYLVPQTVLQYVERHKLYK
jgi:nicotinate-nucleotide adenylyltransferase